MRSSFVAAFLSLLFPGLGQLYAGWQRRALAWAALPLLLVVLVGGIYLRSGRIGLLELVVQPWFLGGLFVGNLVALVYRLAAIVDAWFTARRGPAGFAPRGVSRGSLEHAAGGALGLASVIGLAAVLLVSTGVHVAVARYDMLLGDLIACVFDPTSISNCGSAAGPDASGGTGPVDTSGPQVSLPPEGTALPAASLPAWNGTGRLNVLLVGVDQRPAEQVFNTDTLIVVSIDPTTDRVAMFSIPRDTVSIPLPPGPLQDALGSVYTAKVNSIWANLRDRPDLCQGANPNARGFNCLKEIIGYLFGLDVQYYAEVNFQGFTKVVDGLGGVTINVQSPVVDDQYPTDVAGDMRLYIPAGVQHMTGAEALQYARSRHATNDFDRGARQQRVLTSLLAQANFGAIVANLDQLITDFEQTVHTDIPPSVLPQMLGLASKVDIHAIRSYVFAPPLYETEDYVPGVHDLIYPKVALIRAAVRAAFTTDPNFESQREQVAQERATVWVLNGSSSPTEASDVASYLVYQGFAATAPTQAPPAPIGTVQIVVYNGAESRLPVSIARLEAIFGVTTVTTKNDPRVRVDIIITVGSSTPDLTPPPLS